MIVHPACNPHTEPSVLVAIRRGYALRRLVCDECGTPILKGDDAVAVGIPGGPRIAFPYDLDWANDAVTSEVPVVAFDPKNFAQRLAARARGDS